MKRWHKSIKLHTSSVLVMRYVHKGTPTINLATMVRGKIIGTELFFDSIESRDRAFYDFSRKDAVAFLRDCMKMKEEEE